MPRRTFATGSRSVRFGCHGSACRFARSSPTKGRICISPDAPARADRVRVEAALLLDQREHQEHWQAVVLLRIDEHPRDPLALELAELRARAPRGSCARGAGSRSPADRGRSAAGRIPPTGDPPRRAAAAARPARHCAVSARRTPAPLGRAGRGSMRTPFRPLRTARGPGRAKVWGRDLSPRARTLVVAYGLRLRDERPEPGKSAAFEREGPPGLPGRLPAQVPARKGAPAAPGRPGRRRRHHRRRHRRRHRGPRHPRADQGPPPRARRTRRPPPPSSQSEPAPRCAASSAIP